MKINEMKVGDILIESDYMKKHLIMHFRIRPMPKPRETSKSRFVNKRIANYRNWANSVKDSLRQALATQCTYYKGTYPIFENNERYKVLGAAFGFGATKDAPINARRTKKGEIDKRSLKDVTDWDLSNLIKGVEDILNTIVYEDDKQIRYYGPSFAHDTSSDWFSIHIWPEEKWNNSWDQQSVYSIIQWPIEDKIIPVAELVPKPLGQ